LCQILVYNSLNALICDFYSFGRVSWKSSYELCLFSEKGLGDVNSFFYKTRPSWHKTFLLLSKCDSEKSCKLLNKCELASTQLTVTSWILNCPFLEAKRDILQKVEKVRKFCIWLFQYVHSYTQVSLASFPL